MTTTHPTSGRTPVIGQDGTIYILNMHGYLYAVNPSGSIKWEFAPPEAQSPYVFASSNVALGPDDTVYYVLAANPTELIAVSTDGEERWSVPLLFNTLTGLSGIFYWQITVDRVGNAFLCHANSRCYGINPDGEVLWEYRNSSSDLIIKFGISQILAADNLIYFGDNINTLYAFGDPTIYPILTTPEMDLTYQVECPAHYPSQSPSQFPALWRQSLTRYPSLTIVG